MVRRSRRTIVYRTRRGWWLWYCNHCHKGSRGDLSWRWTFTKARDHAIACNRYGDDL